MMTRVFDGEVAGFVSPPETTGIGVYFDPVPSQVSEDVGLIVESSGSTGRPKRLEISLAALTASANASAKLLGGHGQWLLALPANYIAGANVLFRSAVADTQPVISNTRVPFSAEGFLNSASLMRGSKRYTSLVPAQLDRLAACADLESQENGVITALQSFDAILIGGQLPNLATLESLKSRGVKLVESYGMAETSGGCVYDGQALEGVNLEIIDGHVAVSGTVLANGIGEKFLSSDLGEIVNGRLKIIGRADRVIVSGGKKVSLDDVESKVAAEEGVTDVIAVALDSKWGQSVGLVLAARESFDESKLQSILLGPAKPIAVQKVSQVPRLISGKPDYQAARALLAD
jgi:O-succinylbenzoic acid--CoA ligase